MKRSYIDDGWRRRFALVPIFLSNGPERMVIWLEWFWVRDMALYREISLIDPTSHKERGMTLIEAQEAEVLRLRGALDTICVHSNIDWDEVQADPSGKIRLIHTTAVAARFWREGDD